MSRRHDPIQDIRTHRAKYVSLLQLAEYAQLTRRTVYHHVAKGALRAVKIGDTLRVPIAEARRYLGVGQSRSA